MTPVDSNPPDADALWDTLTSLEQFNVILEQWPLSTWNTERALTTLAAWYHDSAAWMAVLDRARQDRAARAWVERLDAEVRRYAGAEQALSDPATTGLNLTWASDIVPTETDWLWWPYLPLGHLSLLVGDGGVGKSLFTLMLASVISRGWTLPDQQGASVCSVGAPARTLLFSTEDSESATIVPRLMLCQANRQLIGVCAGWHNETTPPGEQELFTFEQLPLLETELRVYKPRLVVLDPVQAYIGPKVDMNRANEVRPLLAALRGLAARYGCCVLLVQHAHKGGQGSALHRGLGSADFPAAARSALFVMDHPLSSDQALLCHSKSNLAPYGRTMAFTRDAQGFRWGKPSRLDAETLAGGKRGPDPHEFIEASLWLESRLEGGLLWPSVDVLDAAKEEGFSSKVLYRAKKALKVLSKQQDGIWKWRLTDLTVLSNTPSIITKTTFFNELGISGDTGVTGVTGEIGISDGVKGEEGNVDKEEDIGCKSDIPINGGLARPMSELTCPPATEYLRLTVRRDISRDGTEFDGAQLKNEVFDDSLEDLL